MFESQTLRAKKKWNFIFMWRTTTIVIVLSLFLSCLERILFLTDSTFLSSYIFSYLLSAQLESLPNNNNWLLSWFVLLFTLFSTLTSDGMKAKVAPCFVIVPSWLGLETLKESRLKDEIHDSSLSFSLFILLTSSHTLTPSFLTYLSCAN